MLFRADLPGAAELQEIYGRSYFRADAGDTQGQGYVDYLGEEANHRANADARLELLERYVAPGRLLDVGAAAGFFVAEAAKRGWDAAGVELAEEMASFGRDRLGAEIRTTSFADLPLEPESLDALTMWDYVEHSVDPAGDLRRAATLLRAGAVLAISTGDIASLAARVSGKHWHLMTPRHHNFFFSKGVLERALRDAGFEVLYRAHRASLYSVHYLIYKMRTVADVPLLKGFADRSRRARWGHWALPVNLYDILTVIARRA